MTKTTTRNLLISVTQLLVTEGLSVAPAVYDRKCISKSILAPILMLTLMPIWAVEDRAYGALAMILFLDIAFLSIMAFSIMKNHMVVGAVCLFAFNFFGIGLVYTY